jgi:hypothetical protein
VKHHIHETTALVLQHLYSKCSHGHHTLDSNTYGTGGYCNVSLTVEHDTLPVSFDELPKAAVKNDHNHVFFVCNMHTPEGICPCRFKTKHDLVQHIMRTDDGYHSLNKMEAVSKLMGTDKGPACAAPDDVEEYFIGTPLVSPRSHKSTLDDRCMALRIRMKDSVIEEKKEAEACAPHACMHFDSLTQCMARPGFAEAFADMICSLVR